MSINLSEAKAVRLDHMAIRDTPGGLKSFTVGYEDGDGRSVRIEWSGEIVLKGYMRGRHTWEAMELEILLRHNLSGHFATITTKPGNSDTPKALSSVILF